MLVLGLANVGKSLLVKQLLNQASKKDFGKSEGEGEISMMTNATAGFDTNKLRLPSGKDVFLNEVGSAMISTWHQFISNSRSIIVSGEWKPKASVSVHYGLNTFV